MSDTIDSVFQEGDLVEIQILKKDKDVISLKSIVAGVKNSKEMVIAAPLYKGRLFPIDLGKRIFVIINKNDKGIFSFQALVIGRSKEEKVSVIHILATSVIKKSQRRKFYRVPFYEEVIIKFELEENEKKINEKLIEKYKGNPDIIIEEETDREVNVSSRDISGGGLRFIIKNEELNLGDNIKGIIKLKNYRIEFSAIVTRAQVLPDYNNTYDIGCSFINMEESVRSKIIGYIFAKQRNLVKKD
ncbi:flagellar brake protein [Helicovermis profundi]|uniref:PilZ domain-containing protein n=1 Tax=Helicovermis profundi TaxID=3065157 RepID=A0AAU9EF41_9FIRM|nr:PilZ domain-containing protein [Clostridia bacterium S502]